MFLSVETAQVMHFSLGLGLKEHSTFFLEIGSFSKSPRVKKLSFTVFESIQPISGSGGSTFSLT